MIFLLNRCEYLGNIISQALFSIALLEVDFSTTPELGINQPWIDVNDVGEFLGYTLVMGKMVRF